MVSSAETDQLHLSPAAMAARERILGVTYRSELKGAAPEIGRLLITHQITPDEHALLHGALTARKQELTASPESQIPPDAPESPMVLTDPNAAWSPSRALTAPREPDWAERSMPRGDREL